MFEQVSTFMDEEMYTSKVWDKADERTRRKALNHSMRTLIRLLPNIYSTDNMPVEHLAEQVVWLMKIDDTFQRAELGATNITLDGMSISIKDKDRSLAPFILEVNGISPDSVTGGLSKRKIGRYVTGFRDNYRKGW